MPKPTLILAKNITQANRFARAAGFQRFTYRAVRNAAAIRSVRNAEVYVLPEFLERFDRHAILMALKNHRSLEVIYADPSDFAEAPETTSPTEDELEEAYAFNVEVDEYLQAVGGEPAPAAEPTRTDGRVEVLEELASDADAADLTAAVTSTDPKPAPKPRKPRALKQSAPTADFF